MRVATQGSYPLTVRGRAAHWQAPLQPAAPLLPGGVPLVAMAPANVLNRLNQARLVALVAV